MSMINDALKRAKQAQQQTSAPPPDLPLRPVEPAQQHARQNLGLFVPVLREVEEMLYQWDEPFVADDRAFRARFGLQPTAPDEAARRTVAWARAAFARPARS